MTHTKKELLAEIKAQTKKIIDSKPEPRESEAASHSRMKDTAKLASLACSRLATLLDKEKASAAELLSQIRSHSNLEGLDDFINERCDELDELFGVHTRTEV